DDDRHVLPEGAMELPRDVAPVHRRVGGHVAVRPRRRAAVVEAPAAQVSERSADRAHPVLSYRSRSTFMSLFSKGLAILAGVLVSAGVLAHHSTRGLYDDDREIELTGKVIEWKFINPHPYLIIEAADETGTV